MIYLVQQLVPYIILVFLLGIVVGWCSCARYDQDQQTAHATDKEQDIVK